MLSTRREWNIKSVMICKKIYLTIARPWGRKRDKSKILMPRCKIRTRYPAVKLRDTSLFANTVKFLYAFFCFIDNFFIYSNPSISWSIRPVHTPLSVCLSVYVLACRSICLSNQFCLSVHSCEKISWRNEKLLWQIFTKVNVFWSSYQLNRLCCVASLFEQVCVWVGVGNVL